VRSLVLSDVHADLDALERVLEDAAGRWDRLLLLGDLVGYGDAPAAVVTRLRALDPAAAVRGNHEAMLAELRAGRRPAAAAAVVATLDAHAAALSDDDLAWLAALPERAVAPSTSDAAADGVLLVHGHPDPARPFAYLLGVPAARRAAAHLPVPLAFFGHTHVPGGFLEVDGRWRPVPARAAETEVSVPAGARALLNPGSVAAARDGGPGACYLLFDHARREATIRRLGGDFA
jgi:predicted phosphodiesterase